MLFNLDAGYLWLAEENKHFVLNRPTELAAPSGIVSGAFHEDDAAIMKAADDPADDDVPLARPRIIKHNWSKADLARMADESAGDVARPSGYESTSVGGGVGQHDVSEESEELWGKRHTAQWWELTL